MSGIYVISELDIKMIGEEERSERSASVAIVVVKRKSEVDPLRHPKRKGHNEQYIATQNNR